MMRIISGTRRGKKLQTLSGSDTRPTLERVKQAVFSAIQFEIRGRTVLDLFAGSGQLGLEALSRGAEFCYFNDASEKACKIIAANIEGCGFSQISQLTCKTYADCVTMLKRGEKKVSLLFLDPPYGKGLVDSSIDLTESVLGRGALVVCESAEDDEIYAPMLHLRKEYRYSGIKVTIFENLG